MADGNECSGCVFVAVVRDHDMYARLVKDNPNNAGGEFVAFDNLAENLSVTARYNSFLDSWDYSREAWFVFVHEDYEFLEPVGPLLEKVSRRCIYGTCGARSPRPGDDVVWALNSNRDGSDLGLYGRPFRGQPTVLTADCNCLMVHSSLVREFGLRFDEKLTFDLYAEDFEIAAFERFGIPTKILGVANHHYSFGNIAPRFFVQRRYLMDKYRDASRVYGTTTKQLIGPLPLVLAAKRANRRWSRLGWLRRFGHFFWYRKYSRDGLVRLRVFGLRFKFPVTGKYSGGGEAPLAAPFYPYVEVLRLLGAAAVVWAHYGRFRIPVVRLAVPCFVVISFFFGWRAIESGEFARLRRILVRFAIPFFGWGVISYAVAIAIGTKAGVSPLLWQLTLGHSTCMPLYYLLDMAFMTSFIFVLRRYLSARMFWCASGCVAALCFYVQYSGLNYGTFSHLPLEASYPLGRLAELLPAAVAGCAIAAGGMRGLRPLFAGLALSCVSVALLLSGTSWVGENFGYAGFVMSAGAAGFVLASTAFASVDPRLAKIRLVSAATAGVYFIHTIVGDILHLYKTPKFQQVLLISLVVSLIGIRIPFVRGLFNGSARKRPRGMAST